mgnify:CR=1 FL=1
MFSKREKASLLITSYIPLYLIVILKTLFMSSEKNKTFSFMKYKFDTKEIIIFFLILILLYSMLTFRNLFNIKTGTTVSIEVLEVKNISIDYVNSYLSLYIFPFFSITDLEIFNFCIIFIIILLGAYICYKNDIIYINPCLNFIGYRIYNVKVKFQSGAIKESILITKKERYDILGKLENLYKLEKEVFLDKTR